MDYFSGLSTSKFRSVLETFQGETFQSNWKQRFQKVLDYQCGLIFWPLWKSLRKTSFRIFQVHLFIANKMLAFKDLILFAGESQMQRARRLDVSTPGEQSVQVNEQQEATESNETSTVQASKLWARELKWSNKSCVIIMKNTAFKIVF